MDLVSIDERLWRIFNNVNMWLIYAEAKIYALLIVDALMVIAIGMSLFCVPFIVSALVCLLSSVPNLKTVKSGQLNHVFYGDICKFSNAKNYIDLVQTQGATEVADEVIINSRIAVRKYKTFSVALIISIIGLIGVGVMVILGV